MLAAIEPSAPPSPYSAPPGWQTLARCAESDVERGLFFSEEIRDIARAKTVCAGCPVLAPCLEGALERNEPCGVWGGQLFDCGRIVMVKRGRGRPPKVARPEDQMPAIPIPDHLQPLLRIA